MNATRAAALAGAASMLVATLFLVALSWAAGTGESAVQAAVSKRYEQWVRYRNALVGVHSEVPADAVFGHESFQAIIRMGVPALPYLIPLVARDHFVGYAIYQISKARLHVRRTIEEGHEVWRVDEFPDIRQCSGPPDYRRLWTRWWSEFRPAIPTNFARAHAQWKSAKARHDERAAAEAFQAMRDLGVFAIPSMMEKIAAGEKEFIPAVSYLTDGELPASATPAQALAWWKKNKAKWTIPAARGDDG